MCQYLIHEYIVGLLYIYIVGLLYILVYITRMFFSLKDKDAIKEKRTKIDSKHFMK